METAAAEAGGRPRASTGQASAPREVYPLAVLKVRPQFLAVGRSGRKAVRPSLVLQARPHDGREQPQRGEGGTVTPIRVGLTASRKVGGAVQRNRARRRLRAASRDVLPREAAPDHDYVFIARAGTLTRSYEMLLKDLRGALASIGCRRSRAGSPGGKDSSRRRAMGEPAMRDPAGREGAPAGTVEAPS